MNDVVGSAPTAFPVGYRSFHPDPSINFELNRWLGALPETELLAAAPRIATLDDWRAVMLEFAQRAEREDRLRAAAFYYRAVEFFLGPDDPEKDAVYRKFVDLFYRSIAGVPHRRERVPFDGGFLPVLRLNSGEPRGTGELLPYTQRRGAAAKGTLLMHGGFDSLMEELFDWAMVFAEGGWDVVLFEGPGQGAALRDHGLVMRPEWERPVAAVLDHLAIERAAILGISLGGYLAPRAAAFEPRLDRVIVCDVLDDFFDCFAARAPEPVVAALASLTDSGARTQTNALVERVMGESPSTAWAIRHGMHVCGAADAYEFMVWLRQLRTAPFSDRITQDVLLLAGTGDHIVPLRQLWRQAQNLTSARSVTARVFTAAEEANHHCQIGNVGLALAFVRDWLDFHGSALSPRETRRCPPP